jgi:hypothetical protein
VILSSGGEPSHCSLFFFFFFFSRCFTEPDSAEQIEHFYEIGKQTTAEVILATAGTADQNLGPDLAASHLRRRG